ncbi:MAG: xanthine dehydrogenase molybdopterin binding subunit [Alphaproteobacteria bacterium]
MPETKRETSLRGDVSSALPHDSATKHVSGEALYGDDIPLPERSLQAYVAMSDRAHARIRRLDLDAVRAAPGVRAAIAAADVPGEIDVGPVLPGDPVLADGTVEYAGQALFAVAAGSIDEARAAARLAVVEYEDLEPVLTAEGAFERQSFVVPPHTLTTGDADAAIARAANRLSGTLHIGGQDHFYLEGQVATALPQEDGDMLVHSSTQHPSEVQKLVAKVLGRPANAVTVEVRRMGGGFGGKETQAAPIACIAALLADATGRPVRLRLDRDDDMLMTGKRHDFVARYDVGFDGDGVIEGVAFDLLARCGMSPDLSGSIVDRALFHADNAYYLANARIAGYPCRTNTVSNTAFRGFGGPQGMIAIEHVIDEIARHLGKDPLEVRRANLYGGEGRDVTPYHQKVRDNVLEELVDALEGSSDYADRRRDIEGFNRKSPILKRGLALTPVKFGISFTTTHLNQAGALIHVYTDGSVHLNHGGTEMGQGVYIKVAQVVAHELQVDIDRIKITATTTGKVPNTSATAASSGSDLNGKAAQDAARKIKRRLAAFAAEAFDVPAKKVVFRANRVAIGDKEELSFEELVGRAYLARVPLSATGYYRTPKIWYDRGRARGRPFYYFAYGAAVSEAVIDTLTGEYRILRTDILHDVGRSLNPAIDLGQVEGGFVQGMGWLTAEELWFDEAGRLCTHAPSTYKIPTAGDLPPDFRVKLLPRARNTEDTIYRSKAVGEPPLMLAISAWLAIKDAVASVADHRVSPRLDAPATPERVLMAVEDLKARMAGAPGREAAE